MEAHLVIAETSEAREHAESTLAGARPYPGLLDMVVREFRDRIAQWPFLEQAHVLRMLLERLHRFGPDLEPYEAYWRHQVELPSRRRADVNSHDIDVGCSVTFEVFHRVDLDAGLRLDSLLSRELLPGWQQLSDALTRRRGSTRDRAPFGAPPKRQRTALGGDDVCEADVWTTSSSGGSQRDDPAEDGQNEQDQRGDGGGADSTAREQ